MPSHLHLGAFFLSTTERIESDFAIVTQGLNLFVRFTKMQIHCIMENKGWNRPNKSEYVGDTLGPGESGCEDGDSSYAFVLSTWK